MNGIEAITISILIIGAVCALAAALYDGFETNIWKNLGAGFLLGVSVTVILISLAIAIVLMIYGVAQVVT